MIDGAAVRFSVPLPPVALRRNSETKRHGYRAKLVREYQEVVWCAGNSNATRVGELHVRQRVGFTGLWRYPDEPWERATVHYRWHSIQQPDEDNIIASMKPALDVIKATGPRPLGILADDKGAVVSAEWVKAARKADERVEIEVTPL